MKRIYRTKILSFLATAWRATLTTLLSALSGLWRLLAGLLVRVLLAAATLLTALAALILILLIHWKVPLWVLLGEHCSTSRRRSLFLSYDALCIPRELNSVCTWPRTLSGGTAIK